MDNRFKCEARSWLFRHYCDTDRKDQALVIAQQMPGIEASKERCIYWALEGEERLQYLSDKILDDMRQLEWDVSAYTQYALVSDDIKGQLKTCVGQASQVIHTIL